MYFNACPFETRYRLETEHQALCDHPLRDTFGLFNFRFTDDHAVNTEIRSQNHAHLMRLILIHYRYPAK